MGLPTGKYLQFHFLPPSSNVTRLSVSAAVRRIVLPTAVEPAGSLVRVLEDWTPPLDGLVSITLASVTLPRDCVH
jgi:hypothetical protein